MTVIGPKDLLFDREDIRHFFDASGIPVTDGEIAGILKESIGYPLGVAITAQNMSSGARFSQEIVGRSYQEVYRYFETAGRPVAFPFGYGLSYTTFAYSDLKVNAEKVTFTLTNTGSVAGAEIAQLYVAKPDATVFSWNS